MLIYPMVGEWRVLFKLGTTRTGKQTNIVEFMVFFAESLCCYFETASANRISEQVTNLQSFLRNNQRNNYHPGIYSTAALHPGKSFQSG